MQRASRKKGFPWRTVRAVVGTVLALAVVLALVKWREEAAGMPFSSVSVRHYNTKEQLAEPFLTKNVLRQTDVCPDVAGVGFVSDPDTYLMVHMGGASSGAWLQPFAGSLMGKGMREGYAENPPLGLSKSFVGAFGHYFNAVDPSQVANIDARTRWLLTSKGMPTAMVEYDYVRRDSPVHFRSKAFSLDEIAYMPMNVQGAAGIRWSMLMEVAGMTATHYESAGNPKGSVHSIVITKEGWPCKFVFAAYPANLWYIAECTAPGYAEWQDVTGADFSGTSSPVTADAIGFGLSYATAGWANVSSCFALSLQPATLSDTDARDAVVAGLLANEAKYDEAVAYWEDFWGGDTTRYDGIDPEVRSKGLIGAAQIAANAYKGAIPSGPPFWNGVWIRDACWAVKDMGKLAPDFAKEVVEWWAAANAINDRNSYNLDGVGTTGNNNTDNAAVFLLAMGTMWGDLGADVATFTPLLAQLQSALTYAKAQYVAADKHITAVHPHDYWDGQAEYGPEIVVADVKYESFIDVIWAAALQKAAPMFTALGDAANAAYCSATSAALIEGLEDYRDDTDLGGGLHYAIKTDDSLYDTVLALPANLYAANLLDDSKCRAFLAYESNVAVLGLEYFKPDACVGFSNTAGDETVAMKSKVWGPHIPLVAGELARDGNYELLEYVKDCMHFGSWPEGMKVSLTQADRLVYNNLAHDFPWCLGHMIGLCEVLRELR